LAGRFSTACDAAVLGVGRGAFIEHFSKWRIDARTAPSTLPITAPMIFPYIVITIVGHVLVIGLLHYEMSGAHVAPWIYLAWTVPAAIVLPILMLPSAKGAVVGFQWAKGMHGFGAPSP
jgi:hypothetical protein